MYVKQYCIKQLKSWKHIANFLDEDVKLLLVKQKKFSKIDYCNQRYTLNDRKLFFLSLFLY